MRADSDPRSWREAVTFLKSVGARPVRTKGSHQTWRLPDGSSFTVVCNHLGADIGHGLRVRLRRLRDRRRGEDDPPHRSAAAGRWSFDRGRARLRRFVMSKSGNGGRGSNGNGSRGSGTKGGQPAPSTNPNWPSTTGNPSGGDRGNAPAGK